MLQQVNNSIDTIARDYEMAVNRERIAMAAVEAADGTPEFPALEAELERRMDLSIELADQLLACPSRGFSDVLRKVRILSAIHPDGEGVAFLGGEEIGGAEPFEGGGLNIRALDAIVRDLRRLAA